LNCHLYNLELGLIQGHETKVESGEESRTTQQNQDEDDHQPDWQQQFVDLDLEEL
jgi:hypothetical protein